MTFKYADAFLTIGATNFEKIVQFYRQLLSQEPQVYLPSVYAEFQLVGLRLGIFKPQASHQSEFNNSLNSGMSLCLEVADLENMIAYLTKIGYPPPGEISLASHGKEIYTYDPAGNRLILHQSVKKHED